MSEAERTCDIGEELALALYDYLAEERNDLQEDRDRRLKNIIGKYVVTCDGKKGLLYLQDRRISSKHYWTKFIENAISFNNIDSARKECSKYKFNNPRIGIVNKERKLQFI